MLGAGLARVVEERDRIVERSVRVRIGKRILDVLCQLNERGKLGGCDDMALMGSI